jgi:hypothetical protein
MTSLQLLQCLLLFGGAVLLVNVNGEVFSHSSSSASLSSSARRRTRDVPSSNSLPVLHCLVGGAQSDDPDDPSDDRRRVQQPSGSDRDHYPPRQRPHPRKPKSKSLAEKSLSLTTQVLSATAKQSGAAAYHLLRPKQVKVKELVGLWRLDQSVVNLYSNDGYSNYNDESVEATANLQVSDRGTIILVMDASVETRTVVKYKFTPAGMVSSAKVEFTTTTTNTGGSSSNDHNDDIVLLYRAYIHRKLADPAVIKWKGKIYRIERTGWRGKNEKLVAVGTFVARRRLSLSTANDDDDDDDYSEEDEEEEDWSDPNEDEEDMMLDEEEEEDDDQDEDY